ncbi:MAG: flippase, partial [Anaerolineales bacterium]|nr:flippase [Anaerolineales bacterium]
MNTTGQRVAKNATVLMASQLTTWLLTLLLTLFLPRFLGARAVGQFHFANSLWAIVAMAVTFGMDRYLTKEIARTAVPDTLNGRSRAAHLFGVTLLARTLLYLLGFGGVALYLALLDYPPETAQVVLVIGVAQLLWQYVSAATAVLQGLEQMQAISIGSIAGKALNTVVAIALLLLGYGVLPVAAVTIGAALANLLVLLHALRRSLPLRPSLHPRAVGHALRASARMLRASATYLFTQLSLVIYMQVDIILISLLVDETTIGWYGAADQLFGTLLFIPTVFMTAVFPALSRLYTTDTGSLQRLTSKSFDLLLLLSVPIGLGLLVVAGPAVVLLFGAEFAPSGPVLAVFGIVLILTYQNM